MTREALHKSGAHEAPWVAGGSEPSAALRALRGRDGYGSVPRLPDATRSTRNAIVSLVQSFPNARAVRILAIAAVSAFTTACAEREAGPRPLRHFSDNFTVSVSAEPLPPYAIERTRWRITVRDKETNQPVEGGEGRLFASNRERVTVWDGLARGEELGTYYATVTYPTSGEWAVAVEFRRDSTQQLEKIEWMQEVRPERPVPDAP